MSSFIDTLVFNQFLRKFINEFSRCYERGKSDLGV